MIRVRTALLAVLALLFVCQPAWAQKAKTFAVLPFAVNGPEKFSYLSQGVQDMLISRLTAPGQYQPADRASVDAKGKSLPRSEAEAKSVMSQLKADYLIYGSMWGVKRWPEELAAGYFVACFAFSSVWKR